MDINKKIIQLQDELNYHIYRYYVLADPVISDSDYDKKFRELEELEKEYPEYIRDNSPTQRIGAKPQSELKQIKHNLPMLSLSNVFNESELNEFDNRVKKQLNTEDNIQYMCEPKLDGLAVEIIYKKGEFISGSTRGDGYTGEDVSLNLRTVKSIPLKLIDNKLPIPELLEIRGEIIMTKDEFRKLNQQRLKTEQSLFSNPRNAAAGSLRQLDPSITHNRNLDIFFYGIGITRGLNFETQDELLEKIHFLGLKTNQYNKKVTGVREILEYYKYILNEIRPKLEYDIDGLVIKVNDISYQNRLGSVTRKPRWATAYKFPSHQEITRIEDITIQVGRTGVLTPVAELTPVTIEGVTIKRATLHNKDEIDRKDIRIGDYVNVRRAGEVIPEVVNVVKARRTGEERRFSIPDRCPVCNSKVGKDSDTVAIRCTNINCHAQIIERLKHFVSKKGFNIDGLGDKIIKQLMHENKIKTISDIINLQKEDLIELDRQGEKSSENIIESISKAKVIAFNKFIYSLGIRHVGEHTSELLSEYFNDYNKFISSTYDELINIMDIGEEVAASIIDFLSQPQNKEELNKLIESGVEIVYKKDNINNDNPYAGKTFVLTGKLDEYSRSRAKELLKKLGCRISSSVSKKTDYILLGTDPGSKYRKAQKLDIEVMEENEFISILKKYNMI